jgi:putative nucleotidyltransferase with HDIG domain
VSQIATLPEVTLKIIEIVEDPSSTANDLERIISHDPALCTRVLKVVNSSFYGLPTQIGSIQRAIVMLGLNSVKNIAISGSLARLFRGGRITKEFGARQVWEHSIAVAAAVNLLTKHVDVTVPEIAFHAGLIHDIGLMVEMQAMRNKLSEVLELTRKDDRSFLDCELEVFKADHQDFGLALCTQWRFPPAISSVAGYHHRPWLLENEEHRQMASLVYAADRLVAAGEIGFGGTVDSTELDPIVNDILKLTDEGFQDALEALPEAFQLADQVLS